MQQCKKRCKALRDALTSAVKSKAVYTDKKGKAIDLWKFHKDAWTGTACLKLLVHDAFRVDASGDPFGNVQFIGLLNVVVPPRGLLTLGIGLLSFIIMKLEQILAGKNPDSPNEKSNRAAQKVMKAKVIDWLKETKVLEYNEKTGIVTTLSIDDEITPAGMQDDDLDS